MADFYVNENGKVTRKKKKKESSQPSYYVDIKGNVTKKEQEIDDEELAPVRSDAQSNKRTWFSKGAFEDGYQFGDVLKTIGGTTADIRENLLTGILGIGEGAIDAGATLVGGVGKLFGADEFADKAKGFVKKDLVDEEKIAKGIVRVTQPIAPITNPTNLMEVFNSGHDPDEYSLLGEKLDSAVQSVGQIIATKGLTKIKVPWQLTTGVTSFGGETENAFKNDATYGEAIGSGLISAGAEILTESLFGGSGLEDKGLINVDGLTKGISNKTLKVIADYGIDIASEGSEEVFSQIVSNLGTALYREENLGEILASEEALDGYIEAFVGGALIGGTMSGGNAINSIKTGTDYRTGLTTDEQTVVDKELENRVKEAENEGKELSKKDKKKLVEEIVNDMGKGRISIDTIEEALGGETYKSYKSAVDSKESILKEFNELGKKTNPTLADQTRYNELREQVKTIQSNPVDEKLKSKLQEEVFNRVNKGRLAESYNERARRSEAFEYDLRTSDSKYRNNEKYQETYKKAAESGYLNNTNKTHDFVETIARISADKGVSFDFTNNTKLKESGFAIEGKTVNAYVTNDGITLNIDSAKAWQSTVGHEIAHVLEGTEHYEALKTALFEYAKSKGDYQSRYETLQKLYEGVEGANIDAELTADLVGDYLFTDEAFVNHLSAQNRNIFQKIYDEIKYLCKIVTAGSKEARQLEKIKREFDRAYSENIKSKPENSEAAKYSITDSFTDKNGTHFDNAVLLDTNFFDGISPRNWGDKLRAAVEERAVNNPFILPVVDENGNSALLQFANPKERVKKEGGTKHRVIDELTTTPDNISKLAVIHIDEIVSVSSENSPYHTSENSHGWLDKNGWLHRNANVINAKNGNIYNLTFDIAKTADGRTILYATGGKIKKVGNAEVNSLKIKGSGLNSNFNSNLTQNNENVNNFSENSKTNAQYSISVTDPKLIESLENQEHITTYKAMQLVDGKLYPPMAAKTKGADGKYHWGNPSQLGVWQQATEDAANIKKFKNGVGYYTLNKGDGSSVDAAYNPYEHSSNLVLNDQFESAYRRDNLVTVECVIPASEMSSGYKAKYAKDSTGVMDWKSGVVAGQIKDNKRQVYLSRYLKPVRILSEAETAAKYKEVLDGTDVSVPFNVVSPSLLAELEKLGVNIDYDGSPNYKYHQARRDAKKAASYSLSDSDGNTLTKEQSEYFKDSKLRDDNGSLKVMYHGSEKAGFHVFNSMLSDDGTSLFFVDNPKVAESYSGSKEIYKAQTFRTADDLNNFFAEIGQDELSAVEENGKFTLLDDGDVIIDSDTASGLFEQFRNYTGLGRGSGNYAVYLNLTNPLEVDAEGRNWNNINREFSQEIYDRYKTLTEAEKDTLHSLSTWEDVSIFRDELNEAVQGWISGTSDVYTKNLVSAYQKLGGTEIDMYRLFDIATDNFTEETLRENATVKLKTRDYAQRAKENGYDGVIFKNIVDIGGYGNGTEGASTVAIAFESNQVKSVANESPTADADIRYSLSQDNTGKKLTPEQSEYFKDSKAVDENGNLKLVYHGTRNADFTVFKRNINYFTDSKEMADSYAPTGAKFEGYVNITKPYEIDAKGEKWSRIPIDNATKTFLEKYGVSVFKEGGKWRTSPADIASAVEDAIDNGDYDYDGIIIKNIDDTGRYWKDKNSHIATDYIVFNSNQFKNADNTKPTADSDIRFSLSEAVEETRDLIAMHNVRASKLTEALRLGGLPSPSVAITKKDIAHDNYGEITLLFHKDAIDPQADSRNKVYGSDAWTPTSSNARTEYEVDFEKMRAFEKQIEELGKKTADGVFINKTLVRRLGIEDVSEQNASGLAERLANSDEARAAYLAAMGQTIEPEYKTKVYNKFGNEALQTYIDKVGVQHLASLVAESKLGNYEGIRAEEEAVRKIIRDKYAEEHASFLNRKPEIKEMRLDNYMERNVSIYTIEDFIRNAWEFYQEGGAVTEEVDILATSDKLRRAVNDSDVRAWLESQVAEFLGEPGIRNSLDPFDRYGNSRSFAQTHYEYTAENIVRAMQEASARAESTWGANANSIIATATPSYNSIEEIHADSNRLKIDENYNEILSDIDNSLNSIENDIIRTTKHHADNTYDEQQIIGSIITEAATGERTVAAIQRAFTKEGYKISTAQAERILYLYNKAGSVPTGYFEAKPQRVVGFEEVAAVIIPNTADVKLKQELLNRGFNIAEYDPTIEGDRKNVVNQFEDYMFSLSDVGEAPKRYGNYSTPLQDLQLETAPVSENVQAEAPTTEASPEITYDAPIENAYTLEQEVENFKAKLLSIAEQLDEASQNGDTELVNKLMAEFDEVSIQANAIDHKMKQMRESEAAETKEALNRFTDADAPPEMEAPYYSEDSRALIDNPFEERDIDEVGDRNINAYMYENPEVKPFFQAEAEVMLGELERTVKGERWYNDELYSDTHGEYGIGGQSRQTSEDIAYLLDSLNYSYDAIEKGLKAIIEDNGKENNACSKRIEFLLHDRLAKGYTEDGIKIPANQEYITLLNEKSITEYNEEAFKAFMENPEMRAYLDSLADAVAPLENELYDDALPSPLNMDGKAVDNIVNKWGDYLGLDKNQKEQFRNIVQEYSTSEMPNRVKLYDVIKKNFSEISSEYRDNELAEVKRQLRKYPLKVSKHIQGDFDHYGDLQKHNFGKIRFSKSGIPVDVAWMELSEMFPGYFPNDIINEADQFRHIVELVNRPVDIEEMYELNDEQISEIVDDIISNVNQYKQDALLRAADENRSTLFEMEDIAPVAEEYEAIKPERPKAEQSSVYGGRMKRVDSAPEVTTEEMINRYFDNDGDFGEDVAHTHVKEKTKKKKNRALSHLRRLLLDKGSVFEDLSLKTKNRELQGKWHRMLTSENRAQNFIGKGKDGAKSINAVNEEIKASGKQALFDDYMFHLLNTDRMSLEANAQAKAIMIRDELMNFSEEEIEALSRKRITEETSDADAELIEKAKKYTTLMAVKNKPVFGDKITADVSQGIAARLAQENPEFAQWAKDVYTINRQLVELSVEEGLISQETADLWAEIYPHYVPIQRVGKDGSAVNVPLDTGRTGVNAPFKAAQGGNSDINFLLDTMATRAEQIYRAADRNRFGIELMNTLGTAIDNQAADADFVNVMDNISDDDALLKKDENGKPTFTAFENGKKVTFGITDDMYDALKSSSEIFKTISESKGAKVLQKASSIHRGLLTEFNPVFMITNAVKDVQDVLINSQHAFKTYKSIPRAIKEMKSKGKYYQEYMANGGEQNTYFDRDSKSFSESKSRIKRIIGLPLDAISKANNIIELTPRLAEYIASRESGRSIDVSMLDAARVTTNFLAGGDVTKFLNKNGATFLNASVQGAMQQIRNVREAKANGVKGWLALATKTAIAGLPVLFLNRLLWDDDEEYEELSDYVKENYYVIAKTEDGKFIRIPKGRTLAVIQNAFEQISNAATGDDEADLNSFLELAMNNLAPNNPLEDNIFAPFVQAATNKTWYGEDLVPKRLQDLPAGEQFDESTDAFSKWLGDTFDISPYKANYVLDQISGGVGDVILPMLTPEAENGEGFLGSITAPLKDKFSTDSVFNNQNVSDFYDTMDELTTNAKSSKATDYDVLSYKYMNSINSELGELYQQQRAIQNSSLSDKEKYEKVRDIQEQIVNLTRDALVSYENVNINGEYATVGDRAYRWYQPEDGTEPGEWRKLTDKELAKQNKVTSGLGISPEEYWSNKSEYDFAYESPEKYQVARAIGGYDAYKTYASDLYDIKADKDEWGDSIVGSRKEKVIDYINGLDCDYGHKIILFKSEYPGDDTYNYEIIDYLNNRSDISYDEQVTILLELGFKVYQDGTVRWD